MKWLDNKLKKKFTNLIQNKQDLLNTLHRVAKNDIIDFNTLDIVENIINLSRTQARQIMTTKPHIVSINIDVQPTEAIDIIIHGVHSRLPVVNPENNQVTGIILAKDILPLMKNPEKYQDISTFVRPVISVSETQSVDLLLNEFKASGHHMAIVVDEYAKLSGLITIADILEQAIGYIQHDYDDKNIFIKPLPQINSLKKSYVVKANTPVATFNQQFKNRIHNKDNDTMGGVVLSHFNRIPKKDDFVIVDDIRFTVLKAETRKIQLIQVDFI